MTAQRSPGERTASVHQLKAALVGMKPPVWRRLVVPSDLTLGSLHDVIQVTFGWEGMHLHAFEGPSGGRYAPPEDLDIPVFDEEEAALADVLPGTGDRGAEEGRRPLDQLAERADDLWRAGHPHADEVLGALADAIKPVDKALANRLRKAAFKAGSAK
jgi:Plasmid pRiA4b ORF-3-like protein